MRKSILTIFLMVLGACSGTNNPSSPANTDQLWPLAVGNEWLLINTKGQSDSVLLKIVSSEQKAWSVSGSTVARESYAMYLNTYFFTWFSIGKDGVDAGQLSNELLEINITYLKNPAGASRWKHIPSIVIGGKTWTDCWEYDTNTDTTVFKTGIGPLSMNVNKKLYHLQKYNLK